MELYGRVRRAVLVDGVSQRTAARDFGISRKSVRKMVAFSVPPGYQRQQPVKRPRLGPWVGVIDAILEDDKERTAKQRHTAKACLGAAKRRTSVHGRLHDREGLHARGGAARA